MRAIRFLIYGVPILLLVLFAAAFVNTTLLSTDRRNEITIGSIGEPATLNPIQEADSAASEVNQFLFESLLKYDENLNIVPQLASRYELSQTTTVFCTSPEAAQSALTTLGAAQDRWEKWTLQSANIADDRLLLHFRMPGLEASKEIIGLLPTDIVQNLTILRVDTKENARELLARFREKNPDIVIEREWFDFNAAFEITVRSEAKDVEARFKTFLTEEGKKDAQIKIIDEQQFLAEPAVEFFLREDVRWHDGHPFTSADVVFTYKALMDETVASPRKADFDLIQQVQAISPHQVLIVYRKPYSPALNSWMISILPAHILEGKPVTWWAANFNRKPVGNGPFRFQSWKTNENLRIVRNSDYYLGAPWLDAINFRVLPDPIAIRLAFETRQTDFWGVDPWAVASFKDDPRFQVFRYPSNSYTYVGWSLRRPLFQDKKVRLAFAHAVNIPEMIQYILYGNGVQSTGIFPPHFWFSNPNITPIPYDPEKAVRLLDEAGWKLGPDGIRVKDGQRLSFTLITNQANEVRKDIATLVQDNLRRIGVEVRVEIYEWAVFLTRFVNKGDFDAVVLGWATPPDYDVYQIWHSSQTNPEQLNFVGYKNPEVDRLLTVIRQEYDPKTITNLAGEIQKLIYEDQPYLFLYVPQATSVIWKNSFRICRPTKDGWLDTPVEITKAGWTYYMDWFYRPEYADQLPENRKILP